MTDNIDNTAGAEPIRVVLSHPSHPGNIGAAARAMKTMGLSRLYLVQPTAFPNVEATARASGADDVLERAIVCADFDSAIGDCQFVLGTSARLRTVAMPQYDAREAAAAVIGERSGQETALVFGRERIGLTNEEIDRCNALVYIPTNPDYGSLNLGMAVQIVCYEIRMAMLAAGLADAPAMERNQPAPQQQFEGFIKHLEEMLFAVDFLDSKQSATMMKRLRRLFARAEPAETEIHILRGILAAAMKAAAIKASED